MPSSYTASARYTKQATGENTNTWGIILNSGAFDLVDFNVNGAVTISASGATTLTTVNGATDQARGAILNYTGSTAGVLTIPSVSKSYLVRAATAQLTITNGSSSLVLVAGDSATVMTDGTTIWKVQSADFAGRKITNIAAPTSDLDASTKKYVDDAAFSSITNLPGQTGNAGKFLSTDGTNASWALAIADQTGNSGKQLTTNGTTTSWTEVIRSAARKTAGYTAVAGDRLECDTRGGAFTITLPASPVDRDRVEIWDGGVDDNESGFATFNLTVARNGSTIHGLSEDVVIRKAGTTVVFEYVNSTWRAHL